jgi:7-cyano-7-deazaguanine synthase
MAMQHPVSEKAVVLLSGGLDSTTVLALAHQQGYQIYALTFAYGQRQDVELKAAQRAAQRYHVCQHHTAHIDLRAFGGSALTADIAVPKNTLHNPGHIPVTYVPARNTLFLSYALAWAEVLDARALFIGVNAVDYSGYPDCRPAFIEAFQNLANVATKAGVQSDRPFVIHAPLLNMSKAQIIQTGAALGVDYADTHSCYDPVGAYACGACDACVLRKTGFQEAGVADPTLYHS